MTDTASAREEVMKCEQEIHAIKAALRRVGTTASSSSTTDAEQNSMEIVLLKVKGNPVFLSFG
jgi:copper chaperone CopZ